MSKGITTTVLKTLWKEYKWQILFIIAILILIAPLFAWIVMLLWNWLMPIIFLLPKVTFWQSWGLIILSGLLFRSNINYKKN
jgi:fatty acid desaturase